MKKIWINKASSFKEAETFERDYYLDMGALKRVETMQLLREIYFKINPSIKLKAGSKLRQRGKKGLKDEDRKRLRRVIKIVQQK